MPGRGPQSLKKRQKEQQRREKREEKMAKRLERKRQGGLAPEEPQSETGSGENAPADARPAE